MDNNLKYNMQLAMLKKLRKDSLITEFEYDLIKEKLKNKFKINEDLIAAGVAY
jgi:hypothetical protein